MVRNKIKTGKRQTYSSGSLSNAINACLGELPISISSASRDYGVPRKTLSDHIRRYRNGEKTVYGSLPIFSNEDEQLLAEMALYLCDRGFPVNVAKMCKNAYEFAKGLQRKNRTLKIPASWESNKMAGPDWYFNFRKRHPNISLRKPEGLSAARAAAFNPTRVCEYFDSIKSFMPLNFDPRLIFNIDETGLSSVPSDSSRLIARKGQKTVSKVKIGERGVLTTVIPCISASGDLIPPFVILKGKRMASEFLETVPKDFGISATSSGYVDKDTFIKFLKHFQRHRKSMRVTGTAYMFLDGHVSHSSIEAIEYCLKKNIQLICIPPHTSQRLQPLDTHFNKPLKQKWCELLSEHLAINSLVKINRFEFIKLLHVLWIQMKNRRGLIVDAFKHCGIFPTCNTVISAEYSVNNAFITPPDKSIDRENHQRSAEILKNVVPSPRKEAGKHILRKHVPNICSPEILANKYERQAKFARSRSPLIKSNVKSKMGNKTSTSSTPSTSNGTSKASTSSRPYTLKRTSKDMHCSTFSKLPSKSLRKTNCTVCDIEYGVNDLEWMKCVSCEEWCCELCFETNICANCL